MGITIMASMLMKAGTFLLVLLRLLIKSYRRASATRNSPKPLKWFFIDPRREKIGQMRPVYADTAMQHVCVCVYT